MITIFQPIVDSLKTKAETDTVQWTGNPPGLDAIYSLGDHRGWEVVAVESYRNNNFDLIWLAHCYPQAESTLFSGQGTVHEMLQISSNLAYYLQLSPQKDVLGRGWRMAGDAPLGRLYGSKPTDTPDIFQGVDLPWVVDTVDTYKPVVAGCYSAIHVCNCVPINDNAMILV